MGRDVAQPGTGYGARVCDPQQPDQDSQPPEQRKDLGETNRRVLTTHDTPVGGHCCGSQSRGPGRNAGPGPAPRNPKQGYVVATLDPQNGNVCVLMLNRDLDNQRELVLDWRDPSPTRVLVCETLTGPDLKAANTFEEPMRVAPRKLDAPKAGPKMTFKLPAASYTVAQIATT